MKTALILSVAAGAATAQQSAYGQCGGQGWTGPTTCATGFSCENWNPYYYQCIPNGAVTSTACAALPTSSATMVTSVPAVGSTVVTSVMKASSAPIRSSTFVTSVKQASSSAIKSVQEASSAASSVGVSKAAVVTSTTPSTTKASSASDASTTGKVKYGGINISGFDFGCSTDGTCTVGGISNPGTAGISQMKHFVTDDGLNAFRLPVGWQYLTNAVVGGTLDSTNFGNYDDLVQGCISAGAALCIIDIHNYARWNGAVIGQGGPSNDQFAALWSSLATKYASTSKVAFGIMNEPQGLSSITTWAATVQAAVTAIRKAGATDNMILLPGNDWTHASQFISDGSAAALLDVRNPDGSTTNLIFDVHQYLDSDGSGTSTECTTNNIDAFSTLATWLRTNNRMAFLSETGGGSTTSCETYLCQELAYLNENSDVYLGFTTWAAGMFSSGYALLETPTQSGTTWTDQAIVSKCVVANFK